MLRLLYKLQTILKKQKRKLPILFTYPQNILAERLNINVYPQNQNTYSQNVNDERLSMNTYPQNINVLLLNINAYPQNNNTYPQNIHDNPQNINTYPQKQNTKLSVHHDPLPGYSAQPDPFLTQPFIKFTTNPIQQKGAVAK